MGERYCDVERWVGGYLYDAGRWRHRGCFFGGDPDPHLPLPFWTLPPSPPPLQFEWESGEADVARALHQRALTVDPLSLATMQNR